MIGSLGDSLVVDSYLHCGLTKYLPWEDVVAAHAGAGITAGVMVQHLGEFDNDYLVASAIKGAPWYRSVVLVDQSSPAWRRQLAALASEPEVVGVRVRVDSQTKWGEVVLEADRLHLHAVLYFPEGGANYASAVSDIAVACPATTFVLTHLGAPRFLQEGDSEVERLADNSNVILQLSGLGLWSMPPYLETVPCVRRLLDAFGIDRCVWGSNFPIHSATSELAYARTDPWRIGPARLQSMLSDRPQALWGLAS